MNKILALLTFMIVIVSTGCLPMQSSAVESSQLETDVGEIRQDIWKINKSNADTRKNLDEVKTLLLQQQELNSRSKADLLQEIRELTTEIQVLSEKLNDTNYRISSIVNKVAVPVSTPIAEVSEGEDNQVTIATATGPEELYQTAYADFIKGNYPLAIMGFKEYVENYPESELADNALYWIGESYYSQKEFEKAIKTFSEVISKFEEGDKIPDALLKKGYAYIEINRTAQGVVQLQGLIESYPHTQAARMAKQKLENMGLSPR